MTKHFSTACSWSKRKTKDGATCWDDDNLCRLLPSSQLSILSPASMSEEPSIDDKIVFFLRFAQIDSFFLKAASR